MTQVMQIVLAHLQLADAVLLNPGGWVAWALAGLLAGWLAGQLVRGRGFGCLGDILLGLIGAIVGAFIVSLLPIRIEGTQGFLGTVVVAFIGALLLAVIGRLVGGPSRSRYDW